MQDQTALVARAVVFYIRQPCETLSVDETASVSIAVPFLSHEILVSCLAYSA